MFSKTNMVIRGVILLLLVTIGVQKCDLNKKAKEVSDRNEWLKYKDSQIDSFKNKYNQVIYESSVAKINNESQIKKLSDSIFSLKRKDEKQVKQIQALIRVSQRVKIDTIEIPYIDSVDRYDSSLVAKNTVVIPPKRFKDSTSNYQIDGTVLLDKVLINSLTLPDTSSLRIVEKKEGFFKKRETVIQGVHSNPLFSTNGMQTVIKRGDRPSRWQRWIKPVIAGAISSFITYKIIHSP